MNSYLISIIIPVYNVEKEIEDCLNSVLNQTFKNFEIIIIESGSTDDTVSICNRYAQKSDKIKFIQIEERSAGAARNVGLDKATGKYIAFVDADDYIDANMFETLVETAQKNDYDVTACNFYEIEIDGKINPMEIKEVVKPFVNRTLSLQEGFKLFCLIDDVFTYAIWNRLYRRDLIEDNKIRFVPGPVSEDFIFNCDIYSRCQKSYHVDKCFYYHRKRDNGLARMVTYSYAATKAAYIDKWVYIANKIKNLDDSICSKETKEYVKKRIVINATIIWNIYQEITYRGLFFTEQLDFKKKYFFWGASKGTLIYVNIEPRYENLIFVDSDPKKAGKTLMGYKIILPEQLKDYYTTDSKFIITSAYFAEIYLQLKEMGYVNKLADVSLMEGKTRWDRLHIECFEQLINETMRRSD